MRVNIVSAVKIGGLNGHLAAEGMKLRCLFDAFLRALGKSGFHSTAEGFRVLMIISCPDQYLPASGHFENAIYAFFA